MDTRKILLISEDYIKNNSPVYQNVDPKILRMYIFEAQSINLKYLLPESLYNDLFTQFIAYKTYIEGGGTEPITDRVDERLLSLVEYLKPVILYYTLYNAAYSLHTRITNKGINTQTSDYSQSVDPRFIEAMKKDWKQKAESFASLVIEYCSDNSTLYPEWKTDCEVESSTFHNPLYLGGSL